MQGLEVYNEDGTLQFTTSERLTRFLESFTIGTSAGSRVVLGINTGTPVAIVTPVLSSNTSFLANRVPILSFDTQSQTVSWPSVTGPQVTGYNVVVAVY